MSDIPLVAAIRVFDVHPVISVLVILVMVIKVFLCKTSLLQLYAYLIHTYIALNCKSLSLVRWRYLRCCDFDDFSPSFPIGRQL